MPRNFFFVALVVVALASSLALAGCGGDEGKAKEYVSSGDAELAKLRTATEQLSSGVSRLFEGVFAGGQVEAAQFTEGATKVLVLVDKVSAGAALADKQYARVEGLFEVPDYQKYAALKRQAVAKDQEGLDSLKAFLDKWSTAISSASFDPVAFVGDARDFSLKAEAVAVAVEKLESQAAALKKEKGL